MASSLLPQRHKQKRRQQEEGTSSSTTTQQDHPPYGLDILYPSQSIRNAEDAKDYDLDIVAVHGLNGHRDKTWTIDGVNWLRDLLSEDIPRARIMTWGYDANTYSTSGLSGQYLYDHGVQLVADLSLKRRRTRTEDLPILFVAHSLGGVVVKSALIHSSNARAGALKDHKSIKLSTYGIIFMGTPHQGVEGVSWGQLLLNIGSVFVKTDDRILKNLETHSEWLQQQLGQYGQISNDFVTKFAYEIYKTPLALGIEKMVVPKASAVVPGSPDAEPFGIYSNHTNMGTYILWQKMRHKLYDGDGKGREGLIVYIDLSPLDNFSVPFSLNGIPETDCFVGRTRELATLNTYFQPDGSERKVVFLHGLGGIGKTQLTLRFLRQRKSTYSAIFWLRGNDPETLRQSFVSVASRLHNVFPSEGALMEDLEANDTNKIVKAVTKWLSRKGNDRWMLVFDNVNDPALYNIHEYLPETDTGSILITSRCSHTPVASAVSVQINGFTDPSESIAVLSQTSGRSISEEDSTTRELLLKLEGLPLALATVGAYLKQHSITMEKYLDHYTNSWLQIQKTTPKLPSYGRVLYTTWNISLIHILIREESSLALELLKLWACLDNQDLWFEFLRAGTRRPSPPEWLIRLTEDEIVFNNALRPLCDFGLVQSLGIGQGYSLHSCVHAWAAQLNDPESNLQNERVALACANGMIQYECNLFTSNDRALKQRIMTHARKPIEAGLTSNLEIPNDEFSREQIAFFLKIAKWMMRMTDWERTKNVFRRIAKRFEDVMGPCDLLTLRALHDLGDIYMKAAKYDEADAVYQCALVRFEENHNHEGWKIVELLCSLAAAKQAKREEKEVDVVLLRSLKILEQQSYVSDKALARKHLFALTHVYDKACLPSEEVLQKMIAISNLIYDPECWETYAQSSCLAYFKRMLGDLQAAEVICVRAYEDYTVWMEIEEVLLRLLVKALAIIYSCRGKMEELEGLMRGVPLEHRTAVLANLVIDLKAMKNAKVPHMNRSKRVGLLEEKPDWAHW